jgi:hypothetical protein
MTKQANLSVFKSYERTKKLFLCIILKAILVTLKAKNYQSLRINCKTPILDVNFRLTSTRFGSKSSRNSAESNRIF